jgi:hypothetical protein
MVTVAIRALELEYLVKILDWGRSRSRSRYTVTDSDSTENSFRLRLHDSDSASTAVSLTLLKPALSKVGTVAISPFQ